MPELVETYNRYSGEGLSVLGVFINEPAADTGAYAQRVGIPFPIISDANGKIASAYRLMGVPTHVFIGRDGLIQGHQDRRPREGRDGGGRPGDPQVDAPGTVAGFRTVGPRRPAAVGHESRARTARSQPRRLCRWR